MLIKIINSKFCKNYRKRLIRKILNKVGFSKNNYYNTRYILCCHVRGIPICWKDIKEVKENMNSKYLQENIRNNISLQNCRRVWFFDHEKRISFLQECLDKF